MHVLLHSWQHRTRWGLADGDLTLPPPAVEISLLLSVQPFRIFRFGGIVSWRSYLVIVGLSKVRAISRCELELLAFRDGCCSEVKSDHAACLVHQVFYICL